MTTVTAGPRRPTRPSRPPGHARRGSRSWPTIVLYLAPAAIVLIALLAYPLYQLVQISFYDYNQAQVSGGAPLNFIGFRNYQELFSDGQFWRVLVQTLAFAATCVVSTIAVGIALALMARKLRPWVRNVLFMVSLGAWAVPAVTGSVVWLFMFDSNFGIVNSALVRLGFDQFAGHSWTYGQISAFGLVAAEVVWCSFPFVMVTFYAGMLGVDSEVVEAAALDGASGWRIAWSIYFPLLKPTLMIVTIQSIIWDMKLFGQIFIMTDGGGIAGQNLVLNVYAYQQAFAASRYGAGAAIGVVTVILLLMVTLIYIKLVRRRDAEEL